MKCQKCGAACEEGAKFCPVCGERLPGAENAEETSKTERKCCPRCGAEYSEGAKFCAICGSPLTDERFGYSGGEQGGSFKNAQPSYSNRAFGVSPRSIPLYLVLTLLTCGLFGIYWFVCLVDDLNSVTDTPNDTGGIVVFLLSLITCGIYGLYWFYKAGEKISAAKMRAGAFTSGNEGILYLILSVLNLGIINYCLIQNEINRFSEGR